VSRGGNPATVTAVFRRQAAEAK
ncbi:MAG: hypothetical protein QG586_2, partial [Pseudomonadota bacterium]|nr:hypothetical protein [Pseudomonadota bacterium]